MLRNFKFKIVGHWRHQSRWVSSTARRELRVPLLSGSSFSVGSSTPSDPTDCARWWTPSGHGRTEMRQTQKWFLMAAANINPSAIDHQVEPFLTLSVLAELNTQFPQKNFPNVFAFKSTRLWNWDMAIAPVSLEGKVRNLRRCVPRRCGRSLHGGRGRWSASARRCSLDSTRSCSGCSPAPGWPRIGGPRSWPWWTRGSCRSASAWVACFHTSTSAHWIRLQMYVGKTTKLERIKLDCSSLVVTVRIQRLVCHLVALDSFEKVIHDPLPVSLRVVRTGHFHFLPKTFSTFNWGELAGRRLLHNAVDNANINRLWVWPPPDEVVVKHSAWVRTLVHTIILAAMTSGSSQTDSTKNTCWKYSDSEQQCVKKAPIKKRIKRHLFARGRYPLRWNLLCLIFIF